MQQTARLHRQRDALNAPDLRPSQAVALFDHAADVSLAAVWLTWDEDSSLAHERIRLYATRWQFMRPVSSGETLRQMGLKPGRCYSVILERLRAAHLDGFISSADEERRLIEQWVNEGLCDDRTSAPTVHS